MLVWGALSAANPDSTLVHWKLDRQPGTFEPAGWTSLEVPALTRVQAIRQGLVINEWVDERFDPVKGKRAAADYYGVDVFVEDQAQISTSTGNLLLADIADEADTPLRLIEKANPHLRRDVVPKHASLYALGISLTESRLVELAAQEQVYAASLAAQYEKRRKQVLSFMPDPNSHTAITYTVRSGDYLGRISSRTGAKIEDIRKWNRIKGNTIYPGQKLTVWVPASKKKATEASIAKAEPKPKTESVPKKKSSSLAIATSKESFLTYEVKPGDTLWSIAQKFPGVSADNLKEWNKVQDLIKAGEKLRVNTQTITDYSPEKYPSTL